MDPLVAGLEAHHQQLVALPLGGSLTRAFGIVTAIQRDRNLVLRLVTTGGAGYYLKFPLVVPSKAIANSVTGRLVARQALKEESAALLPVIELLLPSGGELVSAIPGIPLNRYIYGRFLVHQPWKYRDTFRALGKSLARFHTARPLPEPLPATDRRVELRVIAALSAGQVPGFSSLVDPVATGAARDTPFHVVHGNLAFTNILCSQGRIGLIDFENAGSGHGADDLGRVLQHLVCLELAAPGARLLTGPAVRATLAGYQEWTEANKASIGNWLYLHLVDYYVTRFVRRELGARVAGFPVRAKLLEDLLNRGPGGCMRWLASHQNDS